MIQQGEIPDCYGIECCDECAIDCPFYMDCEADSREDEDDDWVGDGLGGE
jgi:hypothetical protein